MSLRRSVSVSDSSVSFRTAVSSVRYPQIHLAPTSSVINFRLHTNVLYITITIILFTAQSRHQSQAVHGAPFYGVLPRALGDAARHVSPA